MPFLDSSESDQSRDDPIDVIAEEFRRVGWLGQVVGPHGSGKTTLCRALATELAHEICFVHYLTVRTATDIQSVFHGADSKLTSGLMVADGLERLSVIQQQLMIHNIRRSKNYRGLLVTSHSPIKLLKAICKTNPSLETLQRVVAYLAPNLEVPISELEKAFVSSKGNVRESLMMLFDWFEETDGGPKSI